MIRHIKKLFSSKKDISIVSKKELDSLKSNIMVSFSNIKQDSQEQKRWINHLYNNHKELESLQTMLKENHHSHEKTHLKDIDNINKWVTHLHETSKTQDENIKRLEENVANAFEKYNKYLIDLFKIVSELKNSQEDQAKNSVKETQKREKTSPRLELTEEQSYSEPETFDMEEEEETPIKHYAKILTRAEKNVIAELCRTNQKLSYKDLAMLTNLSTSTIKNHICHIKNKSFPIKEANDRNGVKRYYVPENIKKVLLSKTM